VAVNAALRYSLARIVIFAVCAVPALLWLPDSIDPLLKLLIALIVSAVLSLLLLGRWRDDLAVAVSERVKRRGEEKAKLRAALAGEDEPDATPKDSTEG
jgi:uncharacterized protein DUF4229